MGLGCDVGYVTCNNVIVVPRNSPRASAELLLEMKTLGAPAEERAEAQRDCNKGQENVPPPYNKKGQSKKGGGATPKGPLGKTKGQTTSNQPGCPDPGKVD